MKCSSCEFENDTDARFCSKCGIKLEIISPECTESLPQGSNFCKSCGYNLLEFTTPVLKELTFEDKLKKIQKYLPKGLADKILSQRDRIEGERKQVTIMFCDLKGFTPLVEKIGADKAYTIMDQVYELLIHAVHDYEGTVNEMTGDGIMALFGAPVALEDAPQRAVQSALAIHRQMAIFNDKLKAEKKKIPVLKMRIGIHSGPVVVGTLGNDLRVEFKAVGDTVNLASRMEQLAEPGSTNITEDSFKLTEGLFRFEALGAKEIKGKEKPISVYRVITTSSRRTRFDVNAERGLTPLVGREREFDILMDGFEMVKSGRGQAFSIVAEAGAGKSRLLYEFHKAVTNEEVTILEGKCLSYARNVAYHPIIDILKADFKIDDRDNEISIKRKVSARFEDIGIDPDSTLTYVLDLLSVKESGTEEINLSPELKRERAMETLQRIVLKGSEQRPLIMVFEDLHWIDSATESLLKGILGNIPGSRVLLLFSYRPEYVHTWGGKSYHNQLNLNRLSNRESMSILSYLLGSDDIEEDLKELVLTKTEGIPFFIEEFVKSLKNLSLIEEREKFGLVKNDQSLSIPSTIQDMIMARVDALPDAAKEILQTGSVIEREFSFELIKRVMDQLEKELLSNLSLLKDSELLYERGVYPDSTFIFKHALTREVVYDSLLQSRKLDYHNKIGQTIETIYIQRLKEVYETLAHHYLMSENQDKAHHYLYLAGEKSLENYAPSEAINYFTKALGILEALPGSEEIIRARIDICFSMYNAYSFSGFPDEMLEVLQKGENLAKKIGDDRTMVKLLVGLGNYYTGVGKPSSVIEQLEELFHKATESKDLQVLAEVASPLALAYDYTGSTYKILERFPEVIDLIHETDEKVDYLGLNVDLTYILYFYCVRASSQLGNFQQARGFLERMSHRITIIDDPIARCGGEFEIGYHFYIKGDGKRSAVHFKKSLKASEELGFSFMVAISLAYIGRAYYLVGDYLKAIEMIEKGLIMESYDSFTPTKTGHYWTLCEIYLEIGEMEKARHAVETSIEISENVDDPQDKGKALIAMGRYLGKTSPTQINRAENSIVSGIKMLEECQYKPDYATGYLKLGELYTDGGRFEEALKSITKAKALYQEMEMEMDYWIGRTHAVLSQYHQKQNNLPQAREQMTKAIEIMKECGADGWVERYEKELVELG